MSFVDKLKKQNGGATDAVRKILNDNGFLLEYISFEDLETGVPGFAYIIMREGDHKKYLKDLENEEVRDIENYGEVLLVAEGKNEDPQKLEELVKDLFVNE